MLQKEFFGNPYIANIVSVNALRFLFILVYIGNKIVGTKCAKLLRSEAEW